MTKDQESRRAEVLAVLRRSHQPLDDDQIAHTIPMNRHYVNAICRRLVEEGLIARYHGADGKLVNSIVSFGEPKVPDDDRATFSVTPRRHPRPTRSESTIANNIEILVENFAGYVAAFEESQRFPGPSLYFHERAIERRRRHHTARSLVDDERFLEYVYAVLPAWGMHRTGQRAKVGDFVEIVGALRKSMADLEELWPLRITTLRPGEGDVEKVASTAWDVIARIRVSTSETQIVAGSKFLHHVLPDLVPPIDRQYTFRFFTGRKFVVSDRLAFLTWFPHFVEIATRCRAPIQAALDRGGFMATSQAKVIDNAIMGYVRGSQTLPSVATSPSD